VNFIEYNFTIRYMVVREIQKINQSNITDYS